MEPKLARRTSTADLGLCLGTGLPVTSVDGVRGVLVPGVFIPLEVGVELRMCGGDTYVGVVGTCWCQGAAPGGEETAAVEIGGGGGGGVHSDCCLMLRSGVAYGL